MREWSIMIWIGLQSDVVKADNRPSVTVQSELDAS